MQLLTGVIGGVAGWFLSGGNPMGAVVGFAVGYGIGAVLNMDVTAPDSATPGIPDIAELQIVTCKEGDPIPDLVGGAKVVGNIFMAWGETADPITQTVMSGGDAKDPDYSEVITGYNYYLSWAQAFCYVTSPVKFLYTVLFDKEVAYSGLVECPLTGGMQTVTLGVDLEDVEVTTVDWYQTVIVDVHSTDEDNRRIYVEGDVFNFDDIYPHGYLKDVNWIARIASPAVEALPIYYGGVLYDNFVGAGFIIGSVSYSAGTGLTTLNVNESTFDPQWTAEIAFYAISGNGATLRCNVTGTRDSYPEGTITERGNMHFFFGTDDQVMHATMAAAQEDTDLTPGYRGLCYAFFDNIWIGTYNRAPNVKVVITRHPSDSEMEELTDGNDCVCFSVPESIDCGFGEFGYNPACAVWYISAVLVGIPTSLLSKKWFSDSCYALCSEDSPAVNPPGVALLMSRQISASQYIDTILQHCSGYLLMSEDGEWWT